MTNEEKVRQKVKEFHQKDSSGHDFNHIERVLNNALEIAKAYPKVNLELLKFVCLLHDTGDYKLHNSKENNWALATELLKDLSYSDIFIKQVVFICDNISFSKPNGRVELPLEGLILQDADRLDAIGAVGIARCFAYGGSKGRPIYNSAVLPKENLNSEQYRNQAQNSPSFNHFYEKLFKLKELMNTTEAKQMAEERHKFMELFIEQFLREIQ